MDLEGLKTQFDAKEARISQLLRDYQELRGRFDAKDAQCKLEKENTRKARSETAKDKSSKSESDSHRDWATCHRW